MKILFAGNYIFCVSFAIFRGDFEIEENFMRLPSESDRTAHTYNERFPIEYPVYKGFDYERDYSVGTESTMPWNTPGNYDPKEMEEFENFDGYDVEAYTGFVPRYSPGSYDPKEMEKFENFDGFDNIQEEDTSTIIDYEEFMVISDSETENE